MNLKTSLGLLIAGVLLLNILATTAATTTTTQTTKVPSTTQTTKAPSTTQTTKAPPTTQISKKAAPSPVADLRLEAPWVAAIFQKLPSATSSAPVEWKFLCSATIAGTFSVITSARCLLPQVYGPKLSSRPHHLSYSDLQVVAGLPTTDIASKDEHTQFGIVGQIRDVYEAHSSGDTPEGDLAAIRLKNLFNFTTPYVKSVSIFESAGTLLEAKETKPGDTLIFAGYDNSANLAGVQTRSQSGVKGSPLKVHSVTVTDISTCIDRYTEAYPTYYFNILCGAIPKKDTIIPCHYQGSGLVKRIKDDAGNEVHQLFAVYSSNSALAKREGTLVEKNKITPPPCTSSDIIFFTKYAHLKRWAISNQFCDNDLAMCKNDRCRPWKDLCSGQVECDDWSDEVEKVCHNQNKKCNEKGQFRCTYGACIQKKLVCDGIRDCPDGSDEDNGGACKGKKVSGASSSCEGIKAQETVTAHCSQDNRPGFLPCEDRVPVGTKAVLRNKEVIATCGRDGKWSRSTRLTC